MWWEITASRGWWVGLKVGLLRFRIHFPPLGATAGFGPARGFPRSAGSPASHVIMDLHTISGPCDCSDYAFDRLLITVTDGYNEGCHQRTSS